MQLHIFRRKRQVSDPCYNLQVFVCANIGGESNEVDWPSDRARQIFSCLLEQLPGRLFRSGTLLLFQKAINAKTLVISVL